MYLHEDAGFALVVTARAPTPIRSWPLMSYGFCLCYNCKIRALPRWSHGPRASPLFSLPLYEHCVIAVNRYHPRLAISHYLSSSILVMFDLHRHRDLPCTQSYPAQPAPSAAQPGAIRGSSNFGSLRHQQQVACSDPTMEGCTMQLGSG